VTVQTERPTAVLPVSTLSARSLYTVLLGTALPLIDYFIVNVALPTIGADLATSAATLELIVAGYGVAFATLLVLGGRLGDAFGRRRLYQLGLTAFTITSLACGIAPDAVTLVIARIAQGASAALMFPQVLAIIQAGTTGLDRSRALGKYGATAGSAMVVGQLLGGLLVAADIAGTSWRPIFLVNVPIGLFGLLSSRRLPESRSSVPLGADRLGTALLGLTLLAFLIPVTEGRALGWPVWAWVLLAVSPIGAVALVRSQRRAERAGRTPLLPPSVLRMPGMRRGLTIGVPFFAAFGGMMFVYAVTLQDGLHLGPAQAGLAMTPMAVAFLFTALASSRLVTRYGHWVVVAGGALQGVGLLSLAGAFGLAWPDVTVLDLAPGMVVCGIGQGMAVTTLFRVVLAGVPADLAGVGSGALSTTQQASNAFGVAVMGSLFSGLTASGALDMRTAFLLVLGLQLIGSIVVVTAGRKLPDPRVS